ncbi:MAG: hypothetical protein FJ008_05510 [Chloroflexi bacterium]|nr:hypothetical protein [Chloroflexota bacterium]MBM3174940.1 hypothetical protein [Chloroflexota bacterium]
MSRSWTVGDRIDYKEIAVTREQLVQEQLFGWEVMAPVVFEPGVCPSFEVMVANSIHTNSEIARRYGLRDAVIPGVRLFSYISDMFLCELGVVWAEEGILSVKFVSPAVSEDVLSTSATVKEVVSEAGTIRLTFDVIMVNQLNEQLVQGTAQITLP